MFSFNENADNKIGNVLPIWSFLQFCTCHSYKYNKMLCNMERA